MRSHWFHAASWLLSLPAGSIAALQSPKRGLVYIANTPTPADNRIWAPPSSGLTWYYNYGPKPAALYDMIPQETFEFVPMLWGVGDDPTDTAFLTGIKEQIKNGRNIKHVLSFTDPEAMWDAGGSNVEPEKAAKAWVANLAPLRDMGIKVSLPSLLAKNEPDVWIPEFLANCSAILKKECAYDFLGLHIFGNMTHLEERINKFVKAHPNMPIWLLEYALHDKPLVDSQQFFNASLEYLDNLAVVERYAYFGSFRSTTSGVGPNAAMLDGQGKLTSIGNWYLGKGAQGGAPAAAPAPNAAGPRLTSNGALLETVLAAVVGVVASALV